MQKFKCHKVVEAMKIEQVRWVEPMAVIGPGGEEVAVDQKFMTKHQPETGGYFVRYEDGYCSFSPASAFESGYAAIGQAPGKYGQLLDGTGPGSMVDLKNRFTYHAVKPGQPERYTSLRMQALDLAIAIRTLTPPTREQSLALTKLEEAVMWANASIARNE